MGADEEAMMAEHEFDAVARGRGLERVDGPAEIVHLYRQAESVINEWLDEADEEGAAIILRAREEAERTAAQILSDVNAQVAEMKVSASERIAAALREAEEAATSRRQAAADEAATLLAESRMLAQRQLQKAEQDAAWRLRQAEADAAALEARAAANVQAIQADVGELQQQLTALIERAVSLLPTLDAARQLALVEPAAVAAPEPAPVDEPDIVEAEIVPDEPAPEPVVEAPAAAAMPRGLGQLVRDDAPIPEAFPSGAPAPEPDRRRGLGRLLGRR